MKESSSTLKFLYFLALLKIFIPYFLQNPVYEAHRDELLYLAEGRHLAFGFMEVPPMLSIFAWLTHAFGDGMFWIKLWPSLFGAATFVITGKIVQSLGGKKVAIFLLFLPFVLGVYLRLFFLFQPNPPEILFWTMMAFGIIRYTQTKENKWLYIFGISAGLGLMSKYSAALFIASLLISLLLSQHRRIFLNKHFWFASLIGLFIFFPNIVWQYLHGFPVVYHMQILSKYQLQYVSHSGFLIDQLLMNLPCVFIWLAGLIYLFFTREGRKYFFIGLTFIFVLFFLLMLRGKNYYSLGAYPVLFAFGAYFIEQSAVKRFKIIPYILSLFAIGVGIYMIPIMLPIYKPAKLAAYYKKTNMKITGLLKWEDLKDHPLPQDFSDMLGWKEMAQKVSKAYKMLDISERSNTVLFCDNYGEASAVNFYGRSFNLPETYSDNASFLNWIPDSINTTMKNFIILTDDKNEMQYPFIKDCVQATLVDSITTPYAREYGDIIILMKGVNDNFRNMFKEKIKNDKTIFN